MAKEGFDWPLCEHALTIGYRGSLTEIIQIIGRATRDSSNKTHAQFTNLIAQPDAENDEVKVAVNNMLKAITASLLMEQVLAPNFKFKLKDDNDDEDEDKDEKTIKIRGFKLPTSQRAKDIIETDLNDFKARILQDDQMLKAMPGNVEPEVINTVLIPKIIREVYPDLSEEDAEADFVAQRKPIKEKDFKLYEEIFQKVHREIKEGKRKILFFRNIEKNLHVGNFYLIDGVMLYLESANLGSVQVGKDIRKDGRTTTVFENGTYSNMLYRSLGKQILKSGKLIIDTYEAIENEFFINPSLLKEEDIQTGWIYVLKSRSTHPEIAAIEDLYKIGFFGTHVDERIRNAKNEATYLFADVIKVASYACYNRNADKLELLLHRFFASACLDMDLFNENGQRITPGEWFVVPFEIIEEAIRLILSEEIVNYKYDAENRKISEK